MQWNNSSTPSQSDWCCSDPAARHDAMDMGMMREGLPPCMQDGDHAGVGAKMLGIGANYAKGLRRGFKENIVDERLVLESDRRDWRRHGEDDMEIGNGQQFGAAVREPLEARQTLTLGAVPIATGIVGDADIAAILASLDMTAKRRRPA